MSDSEEDSGSVGRQRSIFSGMGRVKQINHLREKWSPKPKSPLPDRTFVESPPSSPWIRRPSPDKYSQGPYNDSGRHTPHRAQSANGSPRRQPVVTVVDMERYLAINTWLEHNGINVAQISTSGADKRGNSKDYGLFDDMFSSLDALENSLMSELSYLSYGSANRSESTVASKVDKPSPTPTLPSPELFDYLVVIAPDMVDVTIRNFWNLRENVFEATVAFAHPPESQFRVESLEHFCFPTGIKATTASTSTGISVEKGGELLSEKLPSTSREGDFFVLMISGGGVQGQNVQYAMCMRGMVQIHNGGDDGKSLVLPICYCIIAQIPLIPFFRAVLQGFLDNLRGDLETSTSSGCGSLSSIVTDKHAGYIDDTLQNLTKISLPDKGLSLSVNVFPFPNPELVLTRPHKENDADEKVALLSQWALPSLLSRLSIDRLLQILSLLLVEMKFIVVSDEIPLLSAATLGLASLLHPLGWAGPLISVLPPTMHEYMEAPVPLICGVEELPRDFECSKGTCILYLAESRVQLHVEDKRSFETLQMPELENLSCDLTRFTKEMLGRVTGSFRDNVTPLSTHLVIHRFRRHIEHLISVCAHTREPYRAEEPELMASEKRFVNAFKQTQMYQKYQDDQPIPATIDQSIHQPPRDQPVKEEVPATMASVNTQHDGLKSAASVLFQIALAGVSTLPRSSSQLSMTAKAVVDSEIETQNHEVVELPIMDKVEPGSAKLSSAASSPTARIFFNMKNSPNEKPESPIRGQELISLAPSEQSAQADRPDRTFVWPLSQSDLDIFWGADEANAASPTVVSPGSAHRLILHSPMSDMYESPRRSPNNESVSSYVDDPKSVTRSEHGSIVNAQRADTDTTISIFDAALSEALGSADTADDAWLFDTSDDHILGSHHDNDSDEDRGTKHDSSPEEYASPLHDEENMEHEVFEQRSPSNNPRRSWYQSIDDQNNDRSQTREFQEVALPPDQAKILATGISVDSRGAWEGWCEGKMFVSLDFTTLNWERHGVAFAALNMSLADITSIIVDSTKAIPHGEIKHSRFQLNFGSEAVHFQFSNSPQHDEFFSALRYLIRPTEDHGEARKESLPSASPEPIPVSSYSPPSPRDDEQRIVPGEEEDTAVTAVQAFHALLETDVDLFKRKLQRGFLVEKHGRLGKPHAKLLFTDALCTHILWRKPPATGANDHHELDTLDDQLHHRSSLFSHNKSIPVESITAIVTGKQTTVFRRAAATKADERVCLSILTPTRTLDICVYSLQEFQELYRGFSLLLEEIKQTRDGLD